jgi:16S rRNA (cytosine1402-N4)-methyltransferase
MIMQNVHIPVLKDEVISELIGTSGAGLRVFDGTLGGGGHTVAMLETGARVWCCDLDQSAIDAFLARQGSYYQEQVMVEHSSFARYIQRFEDEYFDAILLDLGYSSNQLATSGRGFSYQNNDELFDLRYNDDTGDAVMSKIRQLANANQLIKILFTNSGETLSRPIGTALFDARNSIKTVGDAVRVITGIIPPAFARKTNAALSRIWQALRIWVNDEFGALDAFLAVAPLKLKPGGRLGIIAFHSLEDKLITNRFRKLSKPVDIDDFGNKKHYFELITKHPIVPTAEEIEANVRSRSALFRVLQKSESDPS